MRFSAKDYVAPAGELVAAIARLLPDYLPGKDTGPVAVTDRRSCWMKTTRSLLETLAQQYQMQTSIDNLDEWGGGHQLKMIWKRGDAASLAVISGWGDRDELEQAFVHLELMKAPQKLLLYTCARWQEAVLEQLTSALLRYPHHIEGEQYIAVNLLGVESRIMATMLEIPSSGVLSFPQVTLTPVPGSPFHWSIPRSSVVGR